MPVPALKELDLDSLKLLVGGHKTADDGMCVMEAVAYVAGEKHSDHPQCACPIISAFLRQWNDDLDDEGRQKLKPYIPRLVGTKATKAIEQQRGWLVADWMIRTHTPAWLELGGMKDQADAIRALPELTSVGSLRAAQPLLDAAKARAAAAWDAARDAARAAAWDAARDAARDAACKAARKKLEPTQLSLQASAFALLDQLIALGAEVQP